MLDVNMEFKQGILMVRLKGVLTKETVHLLEKDLELVIKDNGIKYMLLNLKQIDYIDKIGLETIRKSYNYIVENSGKLIVCGINKLFYYNNAITENLYQINEEITAYEIINI